MIANNRLTIAKLTLAMHGNACCRAGSESCMQFEMIVMKPKPIEKHRLFKEKQDTTWSVHCYCPVLKTYEPLCRAEAGRQTPKEGADG